MNMEANNLIIVQILIDIFMAVLLLGFMLYYFRNRKGANIEASEFQKPQDILNEMRKISQTLEENLKEKKELSNNILKELEKGIKKAEQSSIVIQEAIKESNKVPIPSSSFKDANYTRSSIEALLDKGLTKKDISEHLDIPIVEIDLLLKLQTQ